MSRNAAATPEPPLSGHSAAGKPGRKPGKHSSADYVQTSIYLPRKLKNLVRARLYEQGIEMSGLVEDMLENWLKRQTARR